MSTPLRLAPLPEAADLPGSWVDGGTADHTQVLGLDDAMASEGTAIERQSDLAHLVLLTTTGGAGDTIELQPGGGAEPDVWEIGRDETCEVALAEPTPQNSAAPRRMCFMDHLMILNGITYIRYHLVSYQGAVNGRSLTASPPDPPGYF